MLALNCGMYQEDIGRLRRDEIDVRERSIFWDREKELNNPSRIHHVLWPETLALVKRYLNDSAANEAFTDHRIRNGASSQIQRHDLAFLDNPRPRYLIKPGGCPAQLARAHLFDDGPRLGIFRQSGRKNTV
jgi:integrase